MRLHTVTIRKSPGMAPSWAYTADMISSITVQCETCQCIRLVEKSPAKYVVDPERVNDIDCLYCAADND